MKIGEMKSDTQKPSKNQGKNLVWQVAKTGKTLEPTTDKTHTTHNTAITLQRTCGNNIKQHNTHTMYM